MKQILRIHSTGADLARKVQLSDAITSRLQNELGNKLEITTFIKENRLEIAEWLNEDPENVIILIDDDEALLDLDESLLNAFIPGVDLEGRIIKLEGDESREDIQNLVDSGVITVYKFTIISDFYLSSETKIEERYTSPEFIEAVVLPVIAPEA